MPEIPDFEQLAEPLAEYADDTRRRHIAEQLRLVWNARGAADIALIDVLFEIAPPTVKTVDRALRTLDR